MPLASQGLWKRAERSESLRGEMKPRDKKNPRISFIGNHGMCRAQDRGCTINRKVSLKFSLAMEDEHIRGELLISCLYVCFSVLVCLYVLVLVLVCACMCTSVPL